MQSCDSGGMILSFFPTAEGFYDYTKNQYIYQYKDHLGNVRLSYKKNSENVLEILDRNTYYPFGMNHLNPMGDIAYYNPLSIPYNYKYNQKELQETGFYDYGWRQYMPDIGRWNGMDQLAEQYMPFSPYAYVMNNPVMFFDPDGRYADMPNWLQKLWYATTTHSKCNSNGYGGFTGGEIRDGSGMSPSQVSHFINFLAGGGIGRYTYFTGTASSYSDYNYSQGAYNGSIDLGVGHSINIKGFSSITDWFKDHFVFQVEGKGTFGVQAGIGAIEGGIMTGDIGSFGWSNRNGGYLKKGDGKGHNYLGGVLGIKGFGISGKLDYVTNDWIPTAGDLAEYYPNNGVLNIEGGIGSNYKGESLVIPNRPSIKVGVNTDADEACNYCVNLSYGAKLLLGLDVSIKVGFTGH